jgi:osmotically-inducible protein OsmY
MDLATGRRRQPKGIANNIEVKPSVSPSDIKTKIDSALQRSAALDHVELT